LLCSGYRGRVTRSGSFFAYNKSDFEAIIISRYKAYDKYLKLLIQQFVERFEPWPTWLILCENSFNFLNGFEQNERRTYFKELLDLPHGINPLNNEEKERLIAEYTTLQLHAETVKKNSAHTSQ